MGSILLNEYISNHPFAHKVLHKKVFEDKVEDGIDVEIFYEDIMFNGKKSRMILFLNKVMITSILRFPCSIEAEDMKEIADSMLNDYTKMVLSIDKVPLGVSYYDENGNYGEFFASDDSDERYFLEDVEYHVTKKKWESKYGYKSEKHREYAHNRLIDVLHEYMNINGDDDRYMRDVVEYMRMFSNDNTKKLFK